MKTNQQTDNSHHTIGSRQSLLDDNECHSTSELPLLIFSCAWVIQTIQHEQTRKQTCKQTRKQTIKQLTSLKGSIKNIKPAHLVPIACTFTFNHFNPML